MIFLLINYLSWHLVAFILSCRFVVCLVELVAFQCAIDEINVKHMFELFSCQCPC